MKLDDFIKRSEGRYIWKKGDEIYYFRNGKKNSRNLSEDELNNVDIKFHNTRLLKEVK